MEPEHPHVAEEGKAALNPEKTRFKLSRLRDGCPVILERLLLQEATSEIWRAGASADSGRCQRIISNRCVDLGFRFGKEAIVAAPVLSSRAFVRR